MAEESDRQYLKADDAYDKRHIHAEEKSRRPCRIPQGQAGRCEGRDVGLGRHADLIVQAHCSAFVSKGKLACKGV